MRLNEFRMNAQLFTRVNSILAMYARHGRTRDTRHFYRISDPGNPLKWGPVKWIPLTKNSEADNICPICVAGEGYKVLLWLRGSYTTYEKYQTDVVGVILHSMKSI